MNHDVRKKIFYQDDVLVRVCSCTENSKQIDICTTEKTVIMFALGILPKLAQNNHDQSDHGLQ